MKKAAEEARAVEEEKTLAKKKAALVRMWATIQAGNEFPGAAAPAEARHLFGIGRTTLRNCALYMDTEKKLTIPKLSTKTLEEWCNFVVETCGGTLFRRLGELEAEMEGVDGPPAEPQGEPPEEPPAAPQLVETPPVSPRRGRKRNNGDSVDNGRQGREKQPRTARGALPAAGGGPVTVTTSSGRISTRVQSGGWTGDEAWIGL